MKLFKKESKIEKEEYFSFCVEGIYEHKNDELFVLGIVDGIIQKLDSLFLIGPYGYEEKVEIQEWIEVDSKQNYYALLIDQRFQLEMNKDQKCKNKKGSVYSFDDYSRMCLNQDKLDGIIINPYHKERSIVLNKDVIQHIRTIKEKNIKTYAKAKSYLKDRKRRQKYEIDYES